MTIHRRSFTVDIELPDDVDPDSIDIGYHLRMGGLDAERVEPPPQRELGDERFTASQPMPAGGLTNDQEPELAKASRMLGALREFAESPYTVTAITLGVVEILWVKPDRASALADGRNPAPSTDLIL